MNLSIWIKRLTYNPVLVNIARLLHIGGFLKHLYYQLYSPRDRIKNLYFNGIEGWFHVNNYEELRVIETVFEKGDKDEEDILAPLLGMLQPDDIAYDIGANIGIHTVFIAKKVGENGKVVAFEPESKNYEVLKQNITLNNLNNTIPVKVALGDKVDSGNLYIKKRIGSGAISLIESVGSNFCEKIDIVPGDFLIQEKNLPLPKAVKIDVEGYEYPVVKGLQKTLSNPQCQLVCCEIHSNLYPPETTPPMVIDLLKSLGFNYIKTFNRVGEIHAICYKE